MSTALSIIEVAFAAFCVWLAVRIVNRKERWAKWMLATTIGLPVLYVASIGPACWWLSITDDEFENRKRGCTLYPHLPDKLAYAYLPIGHTI